MALFDANGFALPTEPPTSTTVDTSRDDFGGQPSFDQNNPGMLAYDSIAAKLGASDVDMDGYALFPDQATGLAALRYVFFTIYRDWGIIAALDDFVLNRTIVNPGYNIALVARILCTAAGGGLDPDNDMMSDLTPDQQDLFMDAYRKMAIPDVVTAVAPGGGSIRRKTLSAGARL